ncbi:alpha/beta hydrolase [Streptomyces sp. 6N223]|uniref:alpha/beta hydrolase n=1 Tax=Streptomyces sp. 6N223 TaxID=3457412 RepID=UPI003FD3CAD7
MTPIAPITPPRTALRRIAPLALAFALVCAALLAAPRADASAPGAASPVCTTHDLAVRLSDPGPADQTLRGRLCQPSGQRPSTVQLLVHGLTYNHSYWDFPAIDASHSYVRAAVAAGYATFSVDQIGAGDSSHPPSAAATLPATSVALHDAITALRSGEVGGQAFDRVMWVGHSYGSIHAWYEIPRYRDVDAAILTGVLDYLNPGFTDPTYPAVEDPKFAGSGLDPGYVTTRPGTRGSAYYAPATADPAVVAADEEAKDTAPVPLSPPPAYPHDIGVPTLLVVGAEDAAYCQGATEFDCDDPGTVHAFESLYYTPETPLTVETVPGTGHVLALSTTAPVTNEIMLDWARAHLAP